MKNLWFALLFFAGGISHEVRHPTNCQLITSRITGRNSNRTKV
jgi:hypothetical protein